MKKFLTLLLSILLLFTTAGCGEKHVHEYVETVIPSTCTTKGYTEHKCACGDSYTSSEQALINHDGRYKCSMCEKDFGLAFASIIKTNGTDEQFVIEASDYGLIILTNTDFSVVFSFISDVYDSTYTATLGYDNYKQKWLYVLEWGTKQAYGSFTSLSSSSTSIPCTYSNFNTSVAGLLKEIFSIMVSNANQKLNTYNAGFTMKNLGLNF